ncbi:hypothetical protein PTKIN_Ptkin06aG0197300 [Pterospermum kingtungense]
MPHRTLHLLIPADGILEVTMKKRSEPNLMNPQQPVLNVAPLNCVPYSGPTNPDDNFSSPTQENAEAAETVGPAIIFVLTGASLTETMGPRIGKVDIGEFADSCYFCVILAGVSSDEITFPTMIMHEDIDEDKACVCCQRFFEDQISDLPEMKTGQFLPQRSKTKPSLQHLLFSFLKSLLGRLWPAGVLE